MHSKKCYNKLIIYDEIKTIEEKNVFTSRYT